MKTIAYICSYEINENISNEEISTQSADIRNFCKCHDMELSEIFEETSSRDDFKPVLLNIMSNLFGTVKRLIVSKPDIISRDKDFRDWILDEFSRMNVEIVYVYEDSQEKEVIFEKNLSKIT